MFWLWLQAEFVLGFEVLVGVVIFVAFVMLLIGAVVVVLNVIGGK